MGQIEIESVLLELMRFNEYVTPKMMFNELYPLFKNRYSKDTFRRKVSRSLERLGDRIAKHPVFPYYCLKGHETIMDDDLAIAARRHKFFMFEQKKMEFYDWNDPTGKPHSFAEIYLKPNRESLE
jgi:hypothetical protein